MISTTTNIRSLSSSKNPSISKIPTSRTPTRKNKNIQKSIEDLSKRPILGPKKTFGSTGSLNAKTSSQESLFSKKLISSKNTLSDDSLNKNHITKRNAIKAQPLQSSVENVLKSESKNISLSKEEVTNVQIPELTKEEAESRLENLLNLINRIEDEEKLEFPDRKMIDDLKNQCYRIIFKSSTTEKWMLYFQKILDEFDIEEKKVDEEGSKLTKEFEETTRKINELEAETLMLDRYIENITSFKDHLSKEENRFKTEIDNYETTCQEIFTHFNDSLKNCIYNKCENINNKINEVFETFTKSSLERYKYMETLINDFKS